MIRFTHERWDTVRANYRQWWAGELERPLIHLTVRGADPGRSEPDLPSVGFDSFYGLSVPTQAIVDRRDYDLSTLEFLGDAFPSIWPNFGPGVGAAFLGAELENSDDSTWFHPREEVEVANLGFAFEPENVWLKRIADLTRVAMDRWEGLVLVGMTDIGGTLDILSSFRPGERLLFDLYDDPEAVKARSWELHELWWKYYRYFGSLQRPINPGYTAWTPIFSESPYYMLQCDFCYMIGPEMFDEFVKPELAATCRKLSHAFYHLDGPGQLQHLDSLLAIPELKGVQWVPGDGQPDASQWPEVYRKIRDAGKRIQVFASQCAGGIEILDILADQLGSGQGIILIGTIGPDEREKAQALLEKYGTA